MSYSSQSFPLFQCLIPSVYPDQHVRCWDTNRSGHRRCAMTELLHRGGSDPQPERMAGMTVERVTADALRSSPIDWVKMRLAERETRRAEAAHNRLAQRMGTLGEEWRVLDLQKATGVEGPRV